MDIEGYLSKVSATFASGQATEHSYRAALEELFRSIDPDIDVINEPKRSEGGMPDFLFQRDGVAFGWAEAKDLPKDVVKLKGYSVEQRKRYENAYPNLLYTNGVDFEFIRDKEVIHHTSIADFMGDLGGLGPLPDKFGELERQLQSFVQQKPISIKSAAKLADMMAGKAAIIKDEVGIALAQDPEYRQGLGRQFTTFKDNLLPNLTPGEFADIYAETITYGMFAARLHDDTLDTFSRQEALEKLPKSNPFLRGLFHYIAGYDIPDRLRYVVDDLAEVLRASDPHSLFAEFGKFTARNDPFIHFYETFLAAYNPKKRKSRGVWYTPEPVVDFIVRAVDDVLKTEFDIPDGLADTKKIPVQWDTGQDDPKTGKRTYVEKHVHRVQILDPATGTGTFLAKTVQTIADRVKKRAPGKWSSYVEEELLPRLHGFELLMASYAMCHMKLDMQLTESGYKPSKSPPRLSVWLTNALEPAEREVKDLFFQQLADEARGASEVKRQSPIMCIIGNPPYSGHSSNKGEWIESLMEAYMIEPGGKQRLQERNPKWVKKDEHKFIRMAENLIEKNGCGVVGFISSHGYLSDPTLRGMRWHLQDTFDKIYVFDLHGNSNKEEKAPGGKADENVFDIKQGVSIIIAVKRASKAPNEPAVIFHSDLWGSRLSKNKALFRAQLGGDILKGGSERCDFVPRNDELLPIYEVGFSLEKLLAHNTTGIQSGRESELISFDQNELGDFLATEFPERSYVVTRFLHKPFDHRWFAYFSDPSPFMDGVRLPKSYRARGSVSDHLLNANITLLFARSNKSSNVDHFFASNAISDVKCAERTTGSMFAPLYLYPDPNKPVYHADGRLNEEVRLNLDPKLYAAICKAAEIDPADTDMARAKALSLEGEGGARSAEGVGVRRSSSAEPPPPTPPHGEGSKASFRAATGDARPSEVKVFDYIYGVLHSPDYRATFAEFLKIDFPRIPYPANPQMFAHINEKGEELRRLHLMEATAIGEAPYPFMGEVAEGEGDSVVAAGYPKFVGGTLPTPNPSRKREGSETYGTEGDVSRSGVGCVGRVHINPDQYFDGVPQTAWEFHIGGYQPAQKWLKDRKGRALSWDDIGHYQNIIKILTETDRIMGEIVLPLEA
ncbi:type ISP restriction/modification enzyme [Pontixanthobacter sp.]|uniref:type ISP restriction/modification enzyme n=1 Tax=Pontixanthobacter sp. TaxID=2792078 RepID=UPI003C7EA1AE